MDTIRVTQVMSWGLILHFIWVQWFGQREILKTRLRNGFTQFVSIIQNNWISGGKEKLNGPVF